MGSHTAVGKYINIFTLPGALWSVYRFATKGPDKPTSPDLSEIPWSSADKGSPCPYPMGRKCVIDGHIIYMKKPWSGSGSQPAMAMGKGGGSRPEAPVQKRYYTHAASAFSVGKVIDNLNTVKGDGKVIYNETTALSIVGNWGVEGGAYGFAQYYIQPDDLTSGDPDAMLKDLEVVFSGFSNSANNGTFVVGGISYGICDYGSGSPALGWRLQVYNLSSVNELTTTGSKTAVQSLPGWTDIANSGTVYDGSHTQAKNSVILANEPAASVSAYRGTAYTMIDTMDLTDFGHRLPRLTHYFSANDPDTYNVSDCIDELAERYGLTGAYDTLGIDDEPLYQYVTWGPARGVDAIDPLILAYDLVAQERNGVVYFYNRVNAPVAKDHPVADMGARPEGSASIDPAVVESIDRKDLPSMVEVTFLDSDNENVQDSVNSQRSIFGVRDNVESVDLPIAMTRAKAKSVADRLLWTKIEAADTWKTHVPEQYFYYQHGDVVPFTAMGQDWNILITGKRWGANGVIELEGVPQRLYTLEFEEEYPGSSTPPAAFSDYPFIPPTMNYKIFDHAPLHDEHRGSPGFYVFAAGGGPDRPFRGAAFMSSDDDSDYTSILAISIQATMGIVSGDELGGGVEHAMFDRENSIYVVMLNGQLETVTDSECLSGANRFLVGDEVIGACNCVLESVDEEGMVVYKLSKLLRGLRNTEGEIDGHAEGEYCVHLNSRQGAYFVPLNHKVHKKDRYYKCVSSYADPDDHSGVAHEHVLGTVFPFSAYNVRGSRDGSNNLTITWDRRTRQISRAFAERCPLEEPFEKYEVDILDGATVVRTVEVSDATTASYTAAQQTTDGLTPGDDIDIKIYQLSAQLGRGRVKTATI